MAAQIKHSADDSETSEGRHTREFLLAFVIGTLVGIGLAATWIPERRRRRMTTGFGEGYRRVRKASAAALDDLRRASGAVTRDFREELGASLEAAREEFGEMAHHQLENTRKALRREYKKLRR